MSKLRSDFLRVLDERGFIHQYTDIEGLDALAAKESVTAYIGFDCTAPSLHVGSLVQIMMLRWLQKTGHRPIVLMGGGTTKIGDPSGRDEMRGLLSDEDIAANMAGIQEVFSQFLRFGEGDSNAVMVNPEFLWSGARETDAVMVKNAVMVNNADWLDGLAYIPFLRDYGSHFTVNRMLGFESVKLRLEREHSLSFLEFNYMILQAYDFLELARRERCVLQMGGSDQWGNIVNGVELARRVDNRSLYGLTTPLITTASGAKMGKTAQGAIWLNANQVSPYDYFQYWRNSEDADVGRFLRLFTELPLDEIARLEALEGAELNEAKKRLAFEATGMCHGQAAAEEAQATARETFEKGGIGEGLPVLELARAELAKGLSAFELFQRAGLAESKGAARRLFRQGGARINGEPSKDEMRPVTTDDLNPEGVIKLSAGKKRHALVRVV